MSEFPNVESMSRKRRMQAYHVHLILESLRGYDLQVQPIDRIPGAIGSVLLPHEYQPEPPEAA